MSIKPLAILCVFLASTTTYAGGFFDAFIGGAAEQGVQILDNRMRDDANLQGQKALMQQQHDLEMQRIRAEYQMRADEDERLRRQRAQQAELNRRETQSVNEQIEKAHPGWLNIVRSPSFSQWKQRQPGSIQALASSDRVSDAILMIDLYKRDQK